MKITTSYKLGIYALIILCSGFLSKTYTVEVTEYEIKAAYLFKVIDFVSWPDDISSDNDASNKRICILGESPFENTLNELERIEQNDFIVNYITDLENISQCKILFISQSEEYRTRKIINLIKNNPVLTISDIEGFASNQGMIELKLFSNQIKMLMNLKSIEQSNIRLSANLLELATIVDTQPSENK